MLLTVTEVAKLLRLDRQTIYRKVKDGLIPHTRIGSSIRFDSEAIDRWMLNQSMAFNKKGVI